MYNNVSFIKRIDKELSSDYMIKDGIVSIILDHYFEDRDCIYEDEFIQSYMEGEIENKLIRCIVRSKDFHEWFDESFFKMKNSLLEKLEINNKNQIKIYREIKVNFDWVKYAQKTNKVKIGECWTYKYEKALSYYGPKDYKEQIIFESLISFNDVDWFKTFLYNMSSIFQEECEIRTFSSKKLRSLTVEKKGELFKYQFDPKKKFFT